MVVEEEAEKKVEEVTNEGAEEKAEEVTNEGAEEKTEKVTNEYQWYSWWRWELEWHSFLQCLLEKMP